ncbi:MAG: uridine diphosphate-N-acetylglucosamine-binding protein YvcK [Clostridia bacterium]
MKGIFYWFKDSSKMKRWIMLILVGIVFSSFGMANMIVSEEAISFGQAAKIIAYFVIGFTCVVLGLVFINKRNMELFIEATDYRLDKDEKVNVNSLIFNKTVYNQGPKIVVIGGGSGLNNTLEGLKKHTSNITAVVTVSDYGENFGENNETMLYRQLEDIKNGIGSLALDDNSKMKDLLSYKFKEGALNGVSFSDLYFAAMDDISKSSADAIKDSNEIFKICGKVLPVTKDKMKICAELENGYLIEEKSKIAETVYDKLTKINRVYLNPTNCKALPEVIEAIREADGIIIGPGSLYTNVIPNLLVNGVSRAIRESKAVKLYVCNIMTEPGLTDNYSVADHINAIVEHCGEGLIDYCLYDTGEVIPEYIKKYNLDGAELVEQDLSDIKDKRIKFIKEDMSVIKDDFVRHNSMLIADTLIKIICDDLKFKDRQNEPEYLMMNSKLQMDKEIKKEMIRQNKNKKNDSKKPKSKSKSKFASKYSDRIESIKHADEKAEKRKKARMIKKQTEPKKIEDQEKIRQMLKQKEEIMKAYIDSKEHKEVSRPKDYDEIRKEKIEKFNKGK